MGFDAVRFDQRDGIGVVTLNRPEVLNAYNVQMRDELYQLFTAVPDDSDIRVVLIEGSGRAFCAGADLSEFGTAPSPIVSREVRFLRDVWAALRDIGVPTIAALHGYVLGSGLELAMFCDLRVAADDAVFALPETTLGMVPAAGGSQTLPRLAGEAAALDLMLTGRRVPATEARRLGIVTEVVPHELLAGTARDWAARLAAMDPGALRSVRRAVREGMGLTLEQGLRLETRLADQVRVRAASIEGSG